MNINGSGIRIYGSLAHIHSYEDRLIKRCNTYFVFPNPRTSTFCYYNLNFRLACRKLKDAEENMKKRKFLIFMFLKVGRMD